MRKLLLLLLLSTGIHANPYMEAVKIHSAVYTYINSVAPTLYILSACESRIYVPTFSYSLEQTYKLAMATNDRTKDIVNTIWKTHEYNMDNRLETSLIIIKQGLRNPETRLDAMAACAASREIGEESFSLDVSHHGHSLIININRCRFVAKTTRH